MSTHARNFRPPLRLSLSETSFDCRRRQTHFSTCGTDNEFSLVVNFLVDLKSLGPHNQLRGQSLTLLHKLPCSCGVSKRAKIWHQSQNQQGMFFLFPGSLARRMAVRFAWPAQRCATAASRTTSGVATMLKSATAANSNARSMRKCPTKRRMKAGME